MKEVTWVSKRISVQQFFMKSNVYHLSHTIKNIQKASCTNNIHFGEMGFCSCYFQRFVGHFLSDKVRKCMVYFGLLESFFYISSSRRNSRNQKRNKELCRYGKGEENEVWAKKKTKYMIVKTGKERGDSTKKCIIRSSMQN